MIYLKGIGDAEAFERARLVLSENDWTAHANGTHYFGPRNKYPTNPEIIRFFPMDRMVAVELPGIDLGSMDGEYIGLFKKLLDSLKPSSVTDRTGSPVSLIDVLFS